MNTTNSILLELKESSITKLLNGLKCLDQCGIAYEIIEDRTISEEIDLSKIEKKIFKFGNRKPLTNKSLLILDLLSLGHSYNEIAKISDISIDGVRYYVKKVFKYLGVNNGREAVKIYLTEIKSMTTAS
jgi:DNA-binding CsgD family transcriptional regulator